MKKYLIPISVIVFLLAPVIFSQIDESEQDAVFIQIEKCYRLNEDGSWRFDYAHRVKLLTYQAVTRGMGETFIVFNPQYQTLTIDKSVTTMVDGKKVPSPANAYNDVLPAAVNDAPDYAYLVEKVISHTGLERGCEIELRYHIENKADFIPWMWGEELFGARYPIRQMRVVVEVPEGVELKYEWLNSTAKPVISQTGTHRRYMWEANELPAFSVEDFHPAYEDVVPRLLFSTCPSWKALQEYMIREWSEKLTLEPNYRQMFLQGIEAIEPLGKVVQMRRAISERMITTAVNPIWLGFRVTPLSRVIARGYAQEVEKAGLLVDLARSQNIAAEIVLVSPSRTFAESVPTLLPFTKVAIGVETPGVGKIYIPVGKDGMRPIQQEFRGGRIFSLQALDGLIMMPKSEKDSIQINAQLHLKGVDKVEGKIQLSAKGYFMPYLQLSDADGQKAFVKNIIQQILPPGKVDGITISLLDGQRVQLTANYHSEEFCKKMDYPNWYACTAINSVFDSWQQAISLNRRATAVTLPAEPCEEVELHISAPDSFTWLVPIPASRSKGEPIELIQNQLGEFSLAVGCENNTLHYRRLCSVNNNPVPKEQYPELRRLLIALFNQNIRTFYLQKNNMNK